VGRKMNIKLLVGCLGAVAILILVSFTNVVGVPSTTSNPVNDSPLFSIRTNNANNENNKVITSGYLGKGINAIPFPLRDNLTAQIQKFIDRIRTMDDNTFNRFVDYAINQIQHKDNLKAINVKELIKELRQLRESSEDINVYKDINDERITYLHNIVPTTDPWFPGCILYILLTFIVVMVVLLFFTLIPTSMMHPECIPHFFA
jgi:hypothetical protein